MNLRTSRLARPRDVQRPHAMRLDEFLDGPHGVVEIEPAHEKRLRSGARRIGREPGTAREFALPRHSRVGGNPRTFHLVRSP